MIDLFDRLSDDFIYQPAVESCGVIMKKDDPLAQNDVICPEDLRGLPLIMPRQFMEYFQLLHLLGIRLPRPLPSFFQNPYHFISKSISL